MDRSGELTEYIGLRPACITTTNWPSSPPPGGLMRLPTPTKLRVPIHTSKTDRQSSSSSLSPPAHLRSFFAVFLFCLWWLSILIFDVAMVLAYPAGAVTLSLLVIGGCEIILLNTPASDLVKLICYVTLDMLFHGDGEQFNV